MRRRERKGIGGMEERKFEGGDIHEKLKYTAVKRSSYEGKSRMEEKECD